MYVYIYIRIYMIVYAPKKGHTTRSISISICHLDIKKINHLRKDMKNKVKPSEQKEKLVPFDSPEFGACHKLEDSVPIFCRILSKVKGGNPIAKLSHLCTFLL